MDEVRRLYDELFPRWQTRDDLAHLLIEKFSLPAEKLRQLSAKHPPPASWLEETADPFTEVRPELASIPYALGSNSL